MLGADQRSKRKHMWGWSIHTRNHHERLLLKWRGRRRRLRCRVLMLVLVWCVWLSTLQR